MAMKIDELISLFETVCNDAAAFASLTIRREHHPSTETASQIRYGTMKLIEQALKNIETQALVVPLITGAMEHVLKMYAVSLAELLAGDFEPRRKRYETLMAELTSSPIALEWSESNTKIAEIIARLGLKPDEKLLCNMPRVAEIMLHAFNFFEQYHTNTFKVAVGKSSCERPVMMRSMPRFFTVDEFYENFRMIGLDSAIMVALIAPTYSQTRNPMNDWERSVQMKYATSDWEKDCLRGREEERIQNMRRHDKNFDPEITVDKHLSRVAIGVKRGENIWLIVHADESSSNGKFINFHGQRTSFMPFQVLFENAPTPNSECTDLVVSTRDSWDVVNILDGEQALWLPTFLWQIERKFFANPVDENEEIKYLPGMIKVDGSKENTNLPAVKKTVAITIDPFTVPSEYDYLTDPASDAFIKHLEIAQKDIEGAVFTPRTPFADKESYEKELWFMQRTALAFVTKAKLALDYNNNHKEIYSFIRDAIEGNHRFLFAELANPDARIHQICTHTINGQPAMKDGKVVTKPGSYNYGIQPVIMKTSVDVTKKLNYTKNAVICAPVTLFDRRPPVVITITPESVEDLSYITAIPVDRLPWQIVLTGKCLEAHHNPFSQAQHDPMSLLKNPYKEFPTTFISFGKREYKELFPQNIMSKKEIDELLAEVESQSEKQKAELLKKAEQNK